MTSHSTIEIDGLSGFVREAGDRTAPAIVLLHGYPSSSHMFRELIALLAERFHVIAPDMIGYGRSAAPSTEQLDRVRRFYAELAAGRLDEALGLLAGDISWNDPDGFPYGGVLTGTAAVKEQVFARLGAEWSTFSVVPDQVMSATDGASIFVVGRYRGRNRQTGRSLDAPFVHWWSTAAGDIVRFETFTDTAAFRQAMARP
jgi:ketosteroid isomerase-like protein